MRRSCFWVCVISVCSVSAVHAASLDSLRATLSSMHAAKPLSASLQVHDRQSSGKKDAPKTSAAGVTVHVTDTSKGLNIHFPAAVLARVTKEARALAKNPDASAATHDALTKLDPAVIHGLADFAPALLNKLVGAKVTAQTSVMRGGHAEQLMTFSIPNGVGSADKDSIKHYSGYLKVWLGADGVPVAVQESREYKGSKFFISFSIGGLKNYTLQHVGQRLVVTHYHGEHHGSGLGQSSHSVLDITLHPEVAPMNPATGVPAAEH